MSKDKGGRAAKKPKADKNIKVKGQTPAAGSGAGSASTAKDKKYHLSAPRDGKTARSTCRSAPGLNPKASARRPSAAR